MLEKPKYFIWDCKPPFFYFSSACMP